MKNLGEIIKNKRLELGLSTRDVGRSTSVSHTEIFRIEKGDRKRPAPYILKEISTVLDLSFSQLMLAAGHPIDDNKESYEDTNIKKERIPSKLLSILLDENWILKPISYEDESVSMVLAERDTLRWLLFTFSEFTDSKKTSTRLIRESISYFTLNNVPYLSKISMVLPNKEIFEIFSNVNLNNVSIPCSVVLINGQESSDTVLESIIS